MPSERVGPGAVLHVHHFMLIHVELFHLCSVVPTEFLAAMVGRSVTFWPKWTVESSKQGHHGEGGDGVHTAAGPRVEAGESDGHQVGEFNDVGSGDLAECAGRVDYTSPAAVDLCVVAAALAGFAGDHRPA